MSTTTDGDLRRDAIVESATEQVRALLESHFREICRAAEDSFVGDPAQTEPVAVCSVRIAFGAIAAATKVEVKASWSARHCDESEEEVDPLQTKLDIEPDKELRKAAAKMRQLLKDDNATVKIFTP